MILQLGAAVAERGDDGEWEITFDEPLVDDESANTPRAAYLRGLKRAATLVLQWSDPASLSFELLVNALERVFDKDSINQEAGEA